MSRLPILPAALVLLLLSACAPSGGAIDGPHGIQGVNAGGPYAYVVPVEGGVVLVDTGMEEDAASIKAAVGDRKVLAILITHSHGDHVGGARAFGDVPVFIGEGDIPTLRNERGHRGLLQRTLGSLMAQPEPPTNVQGVQGGTVLHFGADVFEAFSLPGHTPGSTAWRFRDVLFTGDAVFGGSQLSAAPAFLSDDPEQANASVHILETIDFDVLMDGHNGRTDGAHEKLPRR